MKTKLLKISIGISLVINIILILFYVFFPRGTKSEQWFQETNPQSQHTVTGYIEYEGLDFLAVMGPRKVKIVASDKSGQSRVLFFTKIEDDGGNGVYSLIWTDNGFELTLSGCEQQPLTYRFNWKQIFS